ncbi:MAG: quinon protein alcohol dehydrogenase-like superfamily [Monoraphidium minutum]|nr:MAG: quinon protein alcohol dehydrogenase-like superfamily [Monoraphidium minutum]
MDDPEQRALLYVQQYLRERGFGQALAALEKECGLLYDEDKIARGSELLQLVYGQMEAEAAEPSPEGAAAAARAEEERALLRAGRGDVPAAAAAVILGAHDTNVLSVKLWPGRDLLAAGAADGCVKLLRFDGSVVWSARVASGGALSLDWSPCVAAAAEREPAEAGAAGPPGGARQPEGAGGSGVRAAGQRGARSAAPRRPLLVVGSMDGSVSVLDAETGAALASARPHAKYVVRAAVDPGGRGVIATASFDQSCCLLRLEGGAGGEALRLEVVKQVSHGAAVQDVAFLPPAAGSGAGGGGGGGAPRVVVAVREAGCLWCMDAASGEELPSIPLSTRDNHHSTLSPMRLALSPCGRYLLVALDGPCLLVLRTSDWSRARSLFGLQVPRFHNHAVAWHGDSAYVYAAADGASVVVFHVGSGKVVARLEGRHRINVRDLDMDGARNLLATCSFDKSVRVFEHAGGPRAAAGV